MAYSNSGGELSKNSYIAFKELLVNIGDAFNSETSTFTAPVHGNYEFSYSANTDKSFGGIEVERNGIKRLSSWGSGVEYSSLGSKWLMRLNRGDEIRLKVGDASINTNASRYRIFSGKLVLKSS